MTLTRDQYFQIALGYAQAADDPFVPPDIRTAFAAKAEWFGFLGRREREVAPPNWLCIDQKTSFFSGEFQPTKLPLRMTFCLAGVVLLGITLSLFQGSRRDVNGLTMPSAPPPNVASDQPVGLTGIEWQSAPMGISQTPERLSPSPTHSLPINDQPTIGPTELLTVTANARIRKGPSTRAKKIGIAPRGITFEVKSRQGDWVEFDDPASGGTAWIHSSLAKPHSRNGVLSTLYVR